MKNVLIILLSILTLKVSVAASTRYKLDKADKLHFKTNYQETIYLDKSKPSDLVKIQKMKEIASLQTKKMKAKPTSITYNLYPVSGFKDAKYQFYFTINTHDSKKGLCAAITNVSFSKYTSDCWFLNAY